MAMFIEVDTCTFMKRKNSQVLIPDEMSVVFQQLCIPAQDTR
jgi:hypothetical protein